MGKCESEFRLALFYIIPESALRMKYNILIKPFFRFVFILLAASAWANEKSNETAKLQIYGQPAQRQILQAKTDGLGFSGANQTVRILAIRVEFQLDSLAETTGDGKFLLTPAEEPVIDPPPHNKSYFNAQLQALANYYQKVSNNALSIEWEIYPEAEDAAYQLPNNMLHYAPEDGDSLSDQRLSELFRDAVQAADQQDAVPFSDFDSFIVFHAGVGRDVGFDFDPTPNDVPSAFLNLSDLRESVGGNNPAYQGVEVQNGSFFVPDGIILPETESQEGFEIGLLGTATIMFGFQLGLPSLFNPDNGTSGVGRWGLMDQGSGNFQGLLPAEPSAWEKVFMGWEAPVAVSASELNQIAASKASGAPRIYKIPISADEYFLIENRQRDVNGDEIAVGLNETGGKVEFKLVDGFEQLLAESAGVIVSVDEYDFGLPGSGVLIWHIDEKIIRENLADNRINADRENRGVDLEEADGAQDIGQVYGFLSAGAGAENGVPEDAWWSDNPVITQFLRPDEPVAFGPETLPSSDANSGARTSIRLTGFSDSQPVMRFRYENAAVVSGFPKYIGDGAFPPVIEEIDDASPGKEIIVARKDGLILAWSAEGQPFFPTILEDAVTFGGETQAYELARFFDLGENLHAAPVFYDLDGDGAKEIIIAGSTKLIALKSMDENADDSPDILWQTELESRANVLTIQPSPDYILVALEEGGLNQYTLNGVLRTGFGSLSSFSKVAAAPNVAIAVSENRLTTLISESSSSPQIASLSASDENFTPAFITSTIENIAIADFENDGEFEAVLKDVEGNVEIIAFVDVNVARQTKYMFSRPELAAATGLAVADVDADGYKDLIFSSREGVWALNFTGALLENFPVIFSPVGDDSAGEFIEPVLADLGGDRQVEIFVPDGNGDLFVVQPNGGQSMNFPLALGNRNASALGLGDVDDDGALEAAAISGDQFLYVFRLEQANAGSRVVWPFWGGNSAHSRANLERETPQTPGNDLLPVKEVYNYPNPTEGATTTIRYRLNGAADVSIKIIDLAGELVDEFSGPSTPNTVNEVAWPLDNIQEGVYIARVEARGEGSPEFAIFKIAVVK